MESLPPPSQRQNMNTVPFVNRPPHSNQARACLCVRLRACVYVCVCASGADTELGALACWQMRWNVSRYVREHMFAGGGGCWCWCCRCCCCWRCGGQMSQAPSPDISSLYICSNVRWHLKATASARVCLRQPRARRNALPGCNCLNTSHHPSPPPPHHPSVSCPPTPAAEK